MSCILPRWFIKNYNNPSSIELDIRVDNFLRELRTQYEPNMKK